MTTSTDGSYRHRLIRASLPTLCVVGFLAVAIAGSVTQAEEPPERPREPVLAALDEYIGHWRTEVQTAGSGHAFHFAYDLDWLDPGRTIARVVISRVEADETSVVFEGFKGLEPTGDGVYYFAVSPSGRGARGQVVLEGDDLVTAYRGWSPDGNVVEIRDVFEPVEDGGEAFVSRTFLRQAPDDGWQQIGEDHWQRQE